MTSPASEIRGRQRCQSTKSNKYSFLKSLSEKENVKSNAKYATSSNSKPMNDSSAGQVLKENVARAQGIGNRLVDLAGASTVIIPVIVSSMRGGHRCLAADNSKCAFWKFLSGNGGGLVHKTAPLPSQVLVEDLTKPERDKRVKSENEEVPLQLTSCISCHRTFVSFGNMMKHIRLGRCPEQKPKQRLLCPVCEKEFTSVKRFSKHIVLHKRTGKARKLR